MTKQQLEVKEILMANHADPESFPRASAYAVKIFDILCKNTSGVGSLTINQIHDLVGQSTVSDLRVAINTLAYELRYIDKGVQIKRARVGNQPNKPHTYWIA